MLFVTFLVVFSDLLAIWELMANCAHHSLHWLRSWLDQTVCALLQNEDYISTALFEMREYMPRAALLRVVSDFVNASVLEMRCVKSFMQCVKSFKGTAAINTSEQNHTFVPGFKVVR